MMKFIPVAVECYSGYRADEYPGAFYFNNNRYEVKEVIDRWYQGDLNPDFPVTNYFRVVTSSGETFILKHDLESDGWYVCGS
ncbi:MAG TPA: hypothetical protein PL101_07285 [Bacteroidales bacterium]|nr:hypothetical protein [Bacteroidales bacterium]HQK70898.1 hypothetical protein [Bacteroidales bacterium]